MLTAFDPFLHVILLAAATALVGVAMKTLLAIAAHFNLKISSEQEARLRTLVQSAILRAEESVEAAIKRSAAGSTSTVTTTSKSTVGNAKLGEAINDLIEQAPQLSRVRAADLITAELRSLGLGASAGKGLLGLVTSTGK